MKILKALLIVSIFLIGMPTSAQSNEETKTKMFNQIDGDGNEVITIREMIAYYDGLTDKNGVPVDAKKMFYGLDLNKNSIITLNEYVKGFDWNLSHEFVDKWDSKITIEKKETESEITKERQRDKFKKIDSNRDFELSLKEFLNFYKGQTSKKTGKPINGKLGFYAYDFNNDGKITLEEFLNDPDYKVGWARFEDSEEKSESKYEAKVESTIADPPSDAYVNKRIDMFYDVDVDKNYKITLKELQDYYKDKTNKSGNPINAELRFYGLDTNEDGTIELAEFAAKIDWKIANQKYKAKKQ